MTEDLIIAVKGIALIIEAEGCADAPMWPQGMSGVTIGIGYDLGYHTPNEIRQDWGPHLPASVVDRLAVAAGVKGIKAKEYARRLRDIRIPKEMSARVFEEVDIPRWIRRAAKTFVGYIELPDEIQGALVSLVFNRGTRMESHTAADERSEMRAIQRVIASLVPLKIKQREIANELRKMKRLWDGSLMAPYNVKFGGLVRRRENEALLVESAKVA